MSDVESEAGAIVIVGGGYAGAQLCAGLAAAGRGLLHLHERLVNVAALRRAADALRLRTLLESAQRLTVLGGGFIGLEIAASTRALGKAVTVLESAPRPLMRSVSPELAEHVLRTHRDSGIDVRLGVAVGGFEVARDRLQFLEVDGQREPVELLVLGIGAHPEMAWRATPDWNAATASWSTRACAPRTRRSSRSATVPTFRNIVLPDPPAGACGSSRCRTPTTRRARRWPRCSGVRSRMPRRRGSGRSKAPCACRWPA